MFEIGGNRSLCLHHVNLFVVNLYNARFQETHV